MTLDRLQSKAGIFAIQPEVAYATTGTATSVGSNQWPGGVAIGSIGGFAQALASSVGGGALFMQPFPAVSTTTGSWGVSIASTGTLSHFNAGVVQFNNTATADNLVLQPPSYPGQVLVIQNVGTKSCSFGTIGTVNNWSTSGTVTAQVLYSAFTINSGSCALLVASPGAVTTTNQWPIANWMKV